MSEDVATDQLGEAMIEDYQLDRPCEVCGVPSKHTDGHLEPRHEDDCPLYLEGLDEEYDR